MPDNRRYDEKEVAEIFKRAAQEFELSQHNNSLSIGLSLADLQAIGAESGIPPEYIARAAASLHKSEPEFPVELMFGRPIGVARTVHLPRRLTEDEWDALVVDLRATFDAKGKIEQDGSFRQWTNGNLQVLLEPIGDGCRIRFKTTHSNGKSMVAGGPIYVLMGLLLLLFGFLMGDMGPLPFLSSLIMLIGLGGFGIYGWGILPKWANTRGEQMLALEDRLRKRLGVQEAFQQEKLDVADLSNQEVSNKPAISLDDANPLEEQPQKTSQTRLRS